MRLPICRWERGGAFTEGKVLGVHGPQSYLRALFVYPEPQLGRLLGLCGSWGRGGLLGIFLQKGQGVISAILSSAAPVVMGPEPESHTILLGSCTTVTRERGQHLGQRLAHSSIVFKCYCYIF